ncbi:2-amino-4-hydroxy-6-hydroxymethyldihydropteridine diphosphokinase [Myxococcota bacterium]|nr:2-amino-4-hydroxy-6-hydroxymethyldihydropteridine diphosphokinase [Myxococcota bacterium]
MERAFVGIGTNLGHRETFLTFALQHLGRLASTGVLRCSPWYETAAVGGPAQPDYLNAVACFETTLSPPALLLQLQRIETLAGRERSVWWGPRTLDLDLLCLGTAVGIWEDPPLILPHPRLHLRRFVLQPMADVAPHAQHPTLHREIQELLRECVDPSAVRPYIPQEQPNKEAF